MAKHAHDATLLAVIGALTLAVAAAHAAEDAFPHVRGLKSAVGDAARLLADAQRLSPTVRTLVAALQETDVIVFIELKNGVPEGTAITRLMTATRGARYLLVTIELARPRTGQYVDLGHELRHALEIAQAPEARDADGLKQLFTRIGHRGTCPTCYETDAGIEAGARVLAELREASRPIR